jgi:hypothetical protein
MRRSYPEINFKSEKNQSPFSEYDKSMTYFGVVAHYLCAEIVMDFTEKFVYKIIKKCSNEI